LRLAKKPKLRMRTKPFGRMCSKKRHKNSLSDRGSNFSNWLVNKAKIEPKTVQGILRHAKVQTTLDLYTQEDSDETLAAQGEYLAALGVGSPMVQ
jgi:hypothetical protein